MNNKKVKLFQEKIIHWIKSKDSGKELNYRNFPWRQTDDNYKLLITEILLQKTNSEKVAGLYPIFFKKYRSIEDIYSTTITKLIRILNPLGLQNEKADRLKNIAEEISKNFGGIVPRDKDSLLNLKGVGDYIANAMLCFGFDKKYEIVDSNIIRIYHRIFNLRSDKSRPRTDKKVWDFANRMLPEKNFRIFNFALLDFAAKICKARNPLCEDCFFYKYCCFYLEQHS